MSHTNLAMEYAARTDVGRVREHNEDSLGLRPDLGLVVLADGLGGYNAGEVASCRAVEFLQATMEPFIQQPPDYASLRELLVEAIAVTNRNIHREALNVPEHHGMATTIVAAIFLVDKVLVANVGDSRLYRLRGDVLEQLSEDHTVLQSMLDQNLGGMVDGKLVNASGILTRALGVETDVAVFSDEFALEPGDTFLLCSDGLTDMLADREILGGLLQHRDSLESACNCLVELANEWGGRDNVTVILARTIGEFRPSHECPSALG